MTEAAQTQPLAVLIVEDEAMIAFDLRDTVKKLGHRVLGPVPSVEQALDLIARERPDHALLDENLDGVLATPVASELSRLGISFTIVSGYVRSLSEDPLLTNAQRIAKPATEKEIATALADIIATSNMKSGSGS